VNYLSFTSQLWEEDNIKNGTYKKEHGRENRHTAGNRETWVSIEHLKELEYRPA
jgi:hypothetical protein